jgi:hypothetical protein
MASVTHSFMKLFRPSTTVPGQGVRPVSTTQRLTRRSSGLGAVSRTLQSEEPICVLDIGSTSAANIRYLTQRGHKIYSEDLLEASTDPALITKDEQGQIILDSRRFLADNLVYPAAQFDIVLCWNLADYDILEMQHVEARRDLRRGPTGVLHTSIEKSFRLQRVFNNRHVENLFRDFGSIKFFLTRDNIREVLVVR